MLVICITTNIVITIPPFPPGPPWRVAEESSGPCVVWTRTCSLWHSVCALRPCGHMASCPHCSQKFTQDYKHMCNNKCWVGMAWFSIMVDGPTCPKMETGFPLVAISSHVEEGWSKLSLKPDAPTLLGLGGNPTFPCGEHTIRKAFN